MGISKTPDMVDLVRFIGSKQCEVCRDDRCRAENYTLPINECFYWKSAPEEGSNFFVVVSRTDSVADITLTFYGAKDSKCASPVGGPLQGAGENLCVGGEYPSPE